MSEFEQELSFEELTFDEERFYPAEKIIQKKLQTKLIKNIFELWIKETHKTIELKKNSNLKKPKKKSMINNKY